MALFKRRTRQTDELRPIESAEPPGWERRLGGVGASLDSLTHDIRDLVVVTEGNADEDGALMSLLGYRDSTYHIGWATIMYSLNTNSVDSQDDHRLSSTLSVAGVQTLDSSIGDWESRLRSVGELLDRSGTPLRAVTMIDLAGGVLVNAIVPVVDPVPGWELRSIELSNERIQSAARQHRTSGPAPAPR